MKKYFTKEVKIALTAIVAIVLLFIGINFLKGVNIFQASNTYYVQFENVNGLAVSNPVYANGYAVGIVRDIKYDYGKRNNVIVTIELDDEMRVPRGTRSELAAQLMGGVNMSLVLGPNPADILSPGDTIKGGLHVGAMDKVAEMMPQIERLLPKLDSILTNINRLSSDPALAQILGNTAELTGNLNQASADLKVMTGRDVPQLLTKFNQIGTNVSQLTDKMARVDVDGTVNKLNTTLEGVNTLTGNLNKTTTTLNNKLNSRDNTLGLFLNDRALYDNMANTMRNADSLVIDLKAHPKRYVHFSVFGRKDK